MQTSVHTVPLDLLELALESCERRQRRERQYLASMAPRVAAIHTTLEALHAAGLVVTAQDIHIEADDITVQAVSAGAARDWAARRLADARFDLHGEAQTTPVAVWRHADGWTLCITWLPTTADNQARFVFTSGHVDAIPDCRTQRFTVTD